MLKIGLVLTLLVLCAPAFSTWPDDAVEQCKKCHDENPFYHYCPKEDVCSKDGQGGHCDKEDYIKVQWDCKCLSAKRSESVCDCVGGPGVIGCYWSVNKNACFAKDWNTPKKDIKKCEEIKINDSDPVKRCKKCVNNFSGNHYCPSENKCKPSGTACIDGGSIIFVSSCTCVSAERCESCLKCVKGYDCYWNVKKGSCVDAPSGRSEDFKMSRSECPNFRLPTAAPITAAPITTAPIKATKKSSDTVVTVIIVCFIIIVVVLVAFFVCVVFCQHSQNQRNQNYPVQLQPQNYQVQAQPPIMPNQQYAESTV